MNWDDLRILEAVYKEGTYAGAGTRLRIDETTVARRLNRLQAALGVALFDLIDGTRRPTIHCEAIVGHIREMDRHATKIGAVGTQAPGPVARFRIAATNSIAEMVLAPRAGGFLLANPRLALQFLTSSENVNFSRWQADFALRLGKPDKGDFSISKLADVVLYLIEPVEAVGQGKPLVCCYPDSLDSTAESRFLKERGIYDKAQCVTDNVRIIQTLMKTRKALGVLPHYLVSDFLHDPGLRATPVAERREVWLLVQNHLKRDAAARSVTDWIRGCFAKSVNPENRV